MNGIRQISNAFPNEVRLETSDDDIILSFIDKLVALTDANLAVTLEANSTSSDVCYFRHTTLPDLCPMALSKWKSWLYSFEQFCFAFVYLGST